MLSPNVRPSLGYPTITGDSLMAPQAALAAAGTRQSAWLKIPVDSKWAIVQLMAGALGGGSEQVDILQAQDGVGTGSKALTTGVVTAAATDNTNYDGEVNLDQNLDFTNGFAWIAVKITNTGGTGAFVACNIRFGPAAFMGP